MFVSDHIIQMFLWSINVFLDSECSSLDNISWNPNSLRLRVGLHLKYSCSPNNKLKNPLWSRKKAVSELPPHT